MITIAVAGIGLMFVLAGVVGVLDVVQAATWRRVAAERKESWAARQGAIR